MNSIEVFSPVVIKTNLTEIWLDKEGILRVKAVKEGELGIEELKEAFSIYRTLGCHEKKAFQLLDFTVPVLITKEAREYVDKMAPEYFLASAVVTQSLPVRLIINFCMKFFNPVISLKMFNNEDEALKWLRSLNNKS